MVLYGTYSGRLWSSTHPTAILAFQKMKNYTWKIAKRIELLERRQVIQRIFNAIYAEFKFILFLPIFWILCWTAANTLEENNNIDSSVNVYRTHFCAVVGLIYLKYLFTKLLQECVWFKLDRGKSTIENLILSSWITAHKQIFMVLGRTWVQEYSF